MLAKNPRAPLGTWMYASSFFVGATTRQASSHKGLCVSPDTCRSELAREKPEDAAGHLVLRIIVYDLREQARSYRVPRSIRDFFVGPRDEHGTG